MNRIVDLRPHLAKQALRPIAGIVLVLLICVSPVLRAANTADKTSDARDQFANAVRMRTMLEGLLEKDRSISDYKQTIDAYQKVYVISERADEAPTALVAEAELYAEMGALYDAKYYDSAIKTYRLLLGEYPASRFRSVALFGIAQIQKDDQNNLDDAQATFQDFLKKYPHSDRADDARQALKQIAANRSGKHGLSGSNSAVSAQANPVSTPVDVVAPPAASQKNPSAPAVTVTVSDEPAVPGIRVEPRALEDRLSTLKDLQTQNGKDEARIVVTLDNTIEFQSARLASPDRIYFNLTRATIGAKVSAKQFDADSGLLHSVRVAQNRPDVVRVVLDAPTAKDFSAYLLSKPYRLVIEITAKAGGATQIAANVPLGVAPSVAKPPLAVVPPPAPRMAMSDPMQPKTTRVALERKADVPPATALPSTAPRPTSDGDTSLTRALGLKIRRIVIDPGHGGHDTGTIGPHGLLEKDLCLDVGLRLGKMIQDKLPGAEVIYTRQDDTFVPLEERTRIANEAKADLFISIHANSSHDETTRGVETYYLNFSTSDDAMEVAARENALSQESLHDLQDIIKKIARNDKIAESKELAGDVQKSLAQRLQVVAPTEKNRGVKQAPFVVLIGADMPSVLSEISFVSNPNDERLLKKTDQRQRIADGIYRGISSYLDSLNSLSANKQKLVSENGEAENRLDAVSATVATAK